MNHRVQIFVGCLTAFFAAVPSFGAVSHSISANDGSTGSEISENKNDASVIEASLNTAQAVLKDLRERFERNQTFGSTAADVDLEQRLQDSLKPFFESLNSLGLNVNYEAHASMIRSLEKEFNAVKKDDPDRQKKEDALRSKIKFEYQSLLDQLSIAQAGNPDPKNSEAFINAKKTIEFIAAIRQNILNMKKTTNEQIAARPSPSPDAIRRVVGIGGTAIGGSPGGALAESIYDAVVGNTPPSISHDRPFVEPGSNEQPPKPTIPKPPIAEKPPQDPKPEKPVPDKPAPEKPAENPLVNNEAKPPADQPNHQPSEGADGPTPSNGEPASTTQATPNGNTLNTGSGTPPSFGSLPSAGSTSSTFSPPSGESTASGTAFSNMGTASKSNDHASDNKMALGTNKFSNAGQINRNSAGFTNGDIPELPVKRNPSVSFSPESPVRPFVSAGQTVGTSGGTFSGPDGFFAPPKGSNPPELGAPQPIPEPILGVSGTRQGGVPQVPAGAEGFVNGVKIVGRTPSSIQPTQNSEYKSLVGNFDSVKVAPPTVEPQTFQAVKAPELQDPYVYSPGYEPKGPELEKPYIKVGEVTMFTEPDKSAPGAEEIKLASGLVNAIQVLSGTMGKNDAKGILEALQEVVKPPSNPKEKSGDLNLFLKQTKKKKLDSISRILAALKGEPERMTGSPNQTNY